MKERNRHANGLRLAFVLATAALSTAAHPAVEIVRVGIPGKLDDFSPFYVGVKVGIYRNEGLDPQFIVTRSPIIIPALLADQPGGRLSAAAASS